MKTPKSSDSEEVTPSKKVLKQARLPFTTIKDVSPKSTVPQSRKRKLSVPEPELVTKLGKIAKKNDSGDLVVISDDDSKDGSEVSEKVLKLNPIVKLVDTAWKKKLQKTKGAKKRKGGIKKNKANKNGSLQKKSNECNNTEIEEAMEVDTVEESHTVEESQKDTENSVGKSDEVNTVVNCEIFSIEDSNSSLITKKDGQNLDISHVSSQDIDNNSTENIKQEELQKKINRKDKDTNEDNKSPKKPQRTISKTEINNLNTSLISNSNESPNSDQSTPRRSTRKVSQTNSQGDVSLNDSTNTNLTPKQMQKKIESAKKKEDREKERIDREKKKILEKEEREKQKREKDEQKKREREEKEEAKKREREEKEELKKKEREEKEKQRELEKKIREEKEEQKRKEKEEKEEQKRKEKEAKDEEKRKKQEAIELEKLEQEQKKKKAAEAFVSFFVPKQKSDKDVVTDRSISKNDVLSSFTIKSGMRLAPTTRVTLNEENRSCLDALLKEQNIPESSLYIQNLKDGSRKPLGAGKTWPLSDKDDVEDDDDVMIVEDERPPVDGIGEIITCESTTREKLKPKLLAFHDNRRPPYWGTWRKKSNSIKPRQPFKTDEKLLDYEVDSDDDWEEEQDGESIDGSAAGSDDEQDADEYEVDNEVFVPHGYLSDEEATMDEDDVLSLSPETQKARLKHLEDEFETEMKKPTEKLKPWMYGLSWETEDGGRPEKCSDALWNYFEKLSMIMNDPTPLLIPSNETEGTEKKKIKKKKTTDGDQHSPKIEKKKKVKVDDKDGKKQKVENKKTNQEVLKNQPGINTFLTKLKITNVV